MCIHVNVYVCMCMCINMCMYICGVCVYMRVRVCLCVCLYVWVWARLYSTVECRNGNAECGMLRRIAGEKKKKVCHQGDYLYTRIRASSNPCIQWIVELEYGLLRWGSNYRLRPTRPWWPHWDTDLILNLVQEPGTQMWLYFRFESAMEVTMEVMECLGILESPISDLGFYDFYGYAMK